METKKILFIAAMKDEFEPLLKLLNLFDPIEKKPFLLFEKENNYYLISGIGKANAAASIGYFLAKYKVDLIINFGFVGSNTENDEIGKIYFINNFSYLDVDATQFGYEFGQVPQEKANFFTSKKIYQEIFKKRLFPFNSLKTADSFVEKITNLELKNEEFLIDMESTSQIQTAEKFEVPYISLKIISDNIKSKIDNSKQFLETKDVVASNLANVLYEITQKNIKLIK